MVDINGECSEQITKLCMECKHYEVCGVSKRIDIIGCNPEVKKSVEAAKLNYGVDIEIGCNQFSRLRPLELISVMR